MTPNTHGGRRPGAGRKPSPDPPLRVNLRLPRAHLEQLRALGGGYVTRGIRRLLEERASNAPTTASE